MAWIQNTFYHYVLKALTWRPFTHTLFRGQRSDLRQLPVKKTRPSMNHKWSGCCPPPAHTQTSKRKYRAVTPVRVNLRSLFPAQAEVIMAQQAALWYHTLQGHATVQAHMLRASIGCVISCHALVCDGRGGSQDVSGAKHGTEGSVTKWSPWKVHISTLNHPQTLQQTIGLDLPWIL